jgi:GntR family transcriptional regulator
VDNKAQRGPLVDRANPLPLYVQLANWIRSGIDGGAFAIGDRLPPEQALAAQSQLNRNTVRHALAQLELDGLVEKVKGVGTYVRRRQPLAPVHQLDRLTSFIDDFAFHNVVIEDQILSKQAQPADPRLSRLLGLAADEPVVAIERLRIADQTPFVLEQQYYSYRRFGRLLEMPVHGSLYRLLTGSFGADLHHSVQNLRAMRPPAEVAAKLEISPDVPCIYLESHAFTSEDICIEVLHAYYRGDRYTFRVESDQYRREIDSQPSRVTFPAAAGGPAYSAEG